MTKRKTIFNQWRAIKDKCSWPIPLVRGDSDQSPVWVWGEPGLAERICRLLNQSEKKVRRPLTTGKCQCKKCP